MANKTPKLGLSIPKIGPTGDSQQALFNKLITNTQIIDSHTHTPGKGNPITVPALDIQQDLPLKSNSLVDTKSVIFDTLSTTPSAVNSIFSKNGELSFIDGSGNEVTLTSGGSTAGSPGNISGLQGTASVSFSLTNETYTFTSSTGELASLVSGPLIIKNLGASPSDDGVTIDISGTMLSSYTINLPPQAPTTNGQLLSFNTNGGTFFTAPGLSGGNLTKYQITYADTSNPTSELEGLSLSADELVIGGPFAPTAGKITNNNVDTGAAIAGSKITPNFGSQALTSGNVSAATGNFSGNIESQGQIKANTDLIALGNAVLGGDLTAVDGDFSGDVEVDGQLSSFGSFAATGSSTFSGVATFQSIVNFNNNISFGSSVTVTGTLSALGDLSVANNATVSNDIDVAGSVSVGSALSVLSNTTTLNTLNVQNNATVSGNLNAGSLSPLSSLTVSSGLTTGSISNSGIISSGNTIETDGDLKLKSVSSKIEFSQNGFLYPLQNGGYARLTNQKGMEFFSQNIATIDPVVIIDSEERTVTAVNGFKTGANEPSVLWEVFNGSLGFDNTTGGITTKGQIYSISGVYRVQGDSDGWYPIQPNPQHGGVYFLRSSWSNGFKIKNRVAVASTIDYRVIITTT